MPRKTKKRGAGIFTSDAEGPSIFSKAASAVSNTVTAAKNAVVGTTEVAKTAAVETGLPSTLTTTGGASKRLGLASGDTMLGGRRRRSSKKGRKHRRTRRR